MNDLMIEELAPPYVGIFKPFAHPYYQRRKGFMASRAAFSHASFPAGTFAPGQVPKAYKFPSNQGVPKVNTKYGIVSLGGNVPKSDVTKFCSDNGYPAPNFKVMAIPNANTTTDPGGANVENNLDWQMIMQAWHAAYSVPCDITMMIGPNTDNGIADCVTALVKLGCQVVSISWGAAKSTWSAAAIAYTEKALAAAESAGVIITPASGDNSLNDGTNKRVPDYPAASVHVWPVGGTALTVDASGAYVSESAWGDGLPGDEGGGGGFDTTTPIPSYQQGVVPGNFFGIPSSAANADPKTGYQVWSDGTIGIVGGTSASAPLTGGLFGVAIAMGGSAANYQANLYAARKSVFNDVHLGSNGDPAGIGWDDSTGNGSPIGDAFVAVLTGGSVPPPPVPVPPPSTTPIVYATFTATRKIPAGQTIRITN